MSFLKSITIPDTPTRTLTPTRKRTGGFLDRIALPQDQVRATKVFGVRQQAFEAQKEVKRLSGLGGIIKETGIDIFRRTKGAIVGAFSNIFQTFEQFPSKIIEDLEAGAEDIEKSFDVNRPLIPRIKDALKGITKAGARIAGDTAITIFAPVSAAIGAALELTQGQKLIDKTGQVIADKSGITDLEAFQKFAIEHPNAGEDFDRLLFLVLGAVDKTKIDPKRLKSEVKTFVDKLVSSEVKPEVAPIAPKVKGGFLESVVKPEVKAEVKAEVKPTVEITGEKPSKVALSIEERVIEQKLTEGFEGLAGFDPITIKQQARIVSELIAKDIEKAKRMVRGEELVPDNLRGSSLIVGLEEHALRVGDVALLKDLAKSKLTSETSRFAQELRILAERTVDSPVKAIQDVGKARESALEGRTKKKISKIKENVVKEIKTEIKKNATKRQGWEDFIREIKCK